jgi:hypothetical protein
MTDNLETFRIWERNKPSHRRYISSMKSLTTNTIIKNAHGGSISHLKASQGLTFSLTDGSNIISTRCTPLMHTDNYSLRKEHVKIMCRRENKMPQFTHPIWDLCLQTKSSCFNTKSLSSCKISMYPSEISTHTMSPSEISIHKLHLSMKILHISPCDFSFRRRTTSSIMCNYPPVYNMVFI